MQHRHLQPRSTRATATCCRLSGWTEAGRRPPRGLTMPRAILLAAVFSLSSPLLAEERPQRFDRDPGWDGHNNRRAQPRTIKQDFGYGKTRHTGAAGEVGGFITPAAEPAFYARK